MELKLSVQMFYHAATVFVITFMPIMALINQVSGSFFPVDCPPEFLNFELVFKRSLQNDILRSKFEKIKQEINNEAMRCIGSDKIAYFNKDRCHGNVSLDGECSVTSTSIAPTPAATTLAVATTASLALGSKETTITIPTSVFTTTVSTESRKTTTSHTASSTSANLSNPVHSEDFSSTAWTLIDSGNQTSEPGVGIVATPSVRESKSSSPEENHMVMFVSIFGAILGVPFVIMFLYFCRKKLQRNGRSSSVTVKKARLAESFSHTSTMSDNYSSCNGHAQPPQQPPMEERLKTHILVDDSIQGKDYNFLSEPRSENNSSRFINNNSINSLSGPHHGDHDLHHGDHDLHCGGSDEQFHFNTLRTIEMPHALMSSGFGESYTDASLPRTMQKKKKKARPQEDVCLQSISFIDTSMRNTYANVNEVNNMRCAPAQPTEHIYDTPYHVPNVRQVSAKRSCSDVGTAKPTHSDVGHKNLFDSDLNFATFRGDGDSTLDKRWSTLESPSRDSGYQSPIYRTVSQLSGQSDVFSTDSQTTLIRTSSNNSDHSHGNLGYVVGTLPKPDSSSSAKISKHRKDFKHRSDGWPVSLKRDPREKYKEKKSKRNAQPESFVYKDNHYD